MSTRYPDTVTITRPGADARPTDAASGQPVGAVPAPEAVYAGAARLDESREAVMREKGGDTDLEGDAVLVVPGGVPAGAPFDVEADSVLVESGGHLLTGRIASIRHGRRETRLLLTTTKKAVYA